MSIHRIFWKLEIKRALGRLPQLLAGVVVLLFLAGTTALFASRALYGEQASGRIPVGVVLPEEELLAKKALSMIASLDSVNSLCDFLYLDRAGAMEGLKAGELSAVMDVPEGLVRGIMEGTNVPIRIIFPQEAGVESRIFQELTDAGAGTLSAAQAGIYAGNQLCRSYGLESRIPLLEADLNRIFLSYSLPREDYFRHSLVNATGDLTTAAFYAASAYVLVLLLGAVPVSGYLLPSPVVLARKLRMAGVGSLSQVLARTAGLGVLFLAGSVELFLAAAALGVWGSLAGGWSGQSGAGTGGSQSGAGIGGSRAGGWNLLSEAAPWDSLADKLLLAAALVLVCLAAAALVVLVYRLAGNLLGGILLLFLLATAQHFLAGGYLPLVFLPATVKGLAPLLPSGILMDGAGMMLTAQWNPAVFGRLAMLLAVAVALAALCQKGGERE
ncbi:MAG: ABC transporter permease [Lachnospiraceae bacterium]|jgi:ABC-2 type transport system permease protein|nr:ABC transporter permease [Lachnospiraceae bacterium]